MPGLSKFPHFYLLIPNYFIFETYSIYQWKIPSKFTEVIPIIQQEKATALIEQSLTFSVITQTIYEIENNNHIIHSTLF